MNNKAHLGFSLFFAFTIAIFLGGLITMRSSFIDGDYLVQFYPWSKVYSAAVKSFSLPFWSRYFHSGFPLMAEGQIGGFYPLNIIMFFALPFRIAYNYSIILHFVLAGVFTYIYTRGLGAGESGAALAALLFCFGSAYAGCFYNIVTLKTLVWFPLVLLLTEIFLDSKKRLYFVGAGAIAGMQFLAGFLQMAAYSFCFYIIYMLYRMVQSKRGVAKMLVDMACFSLPVILISLPQILLTYPLSQESIRASASLDFALWGSYPPPCLLSVLFPRWMGFLGPRVYIGILSLFFLIYAIINTRLFPRIRPILLIGVLGLFAALGRYNPVYVLLLKITHIYGFRNPSKLLFFALFGASVLSGFGFSKALGSLNKRVMQLAAKIFAGIASCSLLLFFVSKFMINIFRDKIIFWLQNYTLRSVIDKPYHRYSPEVYLEKARSLCRLFARGMDLSDIYVASSIVLIIIAIILALIIIRRPESIKSLKVPIFTIIFLDIFIYSFYGTGFKGNIKPFDYINPSHNKILSILKADKELFRVAPFDLKDERMPWWVMPNANILVGLDSIAAYTPLAEENYRNSLLPLEVVDDSLGLRPPLNDDLPESYELLRLLNVKYIVTARKFNLRFLKKAASEDGVILYKLKGYMPRVFFTKHIKDNIKPEPAEGLRIMGYKDGFLEVDITTKEEGFLVFSENYYPGWIAYLNGKQTDIVPVKGLVQAVYIYSGRNRITFQYNPVRSFEKPIKLAEPRY